MSAHAQIILQLDRIAKIRQASLANAASGDDFWAKVDAAADETYENRVKGSSMTAIDAELAAGARWATPVLREWFSLHESYFGTDLGYAAAAAGQPVMAAYLAAVGGGRVPYEAAQSLADALSPLRLPATRVYPKGTRPANEGNPGGAGMHLLGTYDSAALAAGDGALPSTVGPTGILAVNMSAGQTVGATFRCTNYVAATTKDLALSLAGAAQYTQTILGQEAVAAEAAAGQTAVQVASTAAFTAAEWVLIWESDALQEVGTVASLGTGPTRLVMSANLLNTYSNAAVVIPLFRSVAYQSGASGSGAVRLYALPDRTIAL